MLSGYGRLVRWVLLGMTLSIGVVLAGTSWLSYRSVDRAAAMITDSQGKALIHATHNALHGAVGEKLNKSLAALLEREQPIGLLYVALIAEDGSVVAQAGEPLDARWIGDQPLDALPRDRPVDIGAGRLRIVDALAGR